MWVFKWLLGVPSQIKMWLFGAGGLVTFLAALKLYIYKEKRVAAKEAVEDAQEKAVLRDIEVRKDAKKLSAKEQRQTSGLPDSDVADRLRGRTSDWERL
jgi:hypothetical protein